MGTIVNVTVVDQNERDASLKIEAVFQEMHRIEKLMGRDSPSSDIAKINNAAEKKAVTVGKETFRLIQDSLPISQWTEGKFDITVGPLTSLWDMKNNVKRMLIPSQEEIGDANLLTGLEALELNEANHSVLFKRNGMALDLGGIAKGYAVDRGVEILQQAGVTGGIVDAGGDLRLFGVKPDGGTWRTGIQHPRKLNGIIAILELTEKAVTTSGDYERYFIKDGKRYHHILDPATGYPTETCQSVTIVTHKAEQADAVATGIFVLGPKRGMGLINLKEEFDAIIVTERGEVLVSEGLKGKVDVLGE